jgi:hypothetical protein
MRILLMTILGALLVLLPGCSSKPNATRSYSSPSPVLSIIVEDFGNDSPLSADSTRVYAVRKSGGKFIRKLIVEGEYLGLSRVEWKRIDELEVCISPESMTSNFYNNITLSDGSTSMKIHTTLLQSCPH